MQKEYAFNLLISLMLVAVLFTGAKYVEGHFDIQDFFSDGSEAVEAGEALTVTSQDKSISALFETEAASSTNASQNDAVGLKSEDLVSGTGAEAKTGDTVTVNYLGTLPDGTKFDSSYDRNEPFAFTLGAGGVIEGWERGVVGMKVGGKRRLTVPPVLGYGAKANGNIPANSTLIFEVELLEVERGQ